MSTPDSRALNPGTSASLTRSMLATHGAWLLVPLACHVGFSWIGFNPTDEGWLPAVARRLADGEMPHRDFIFVRPALSAWLQVPLVWWGGEHVLWLSRLCGWLTLGAVCWMWSGRVAPQSSVLVRYALYASAVPLCAHVFPVMAWHSLDGMLLSTGSVALLRCDTPHRRRIAFFLAGLAPLCRQNFVLFPPLLLLAIGGKPKTWFAAGFWSALPSVFYVIAVAVYGDTADFFEQILAPSSAFPATAFVRYLPEPWFWGGIAGGFALAWAAPRAERASFARYLPAGFFLTVALGLAAFLWLNPQRYYMSALGVFGLVIGMTAVTLARGLTPADRLTLIAGLGLTWVTAISPGYNNPGLMSGVLLLLCWRLVHLNRAAPTPTAVAAPVALVAASAIAIAFSQARQELPYRDQPARELRHDAGIALPGAAGLRTNSLTFATLADLRATAEHFESQGLRYAVLTDCAAWWIRSRSRNPLPCDWPQETELGSSRNLFHRVLHALAELPPDSRIIVQKFLIPAYHQQCAPVPSGLRFYGVQNWVNANCQKVGATPFFEIYLPPSRAAVERTRSP